MAQGKIRGGSGGGDKINGIIEEYVAQGNISTGGFVEYINTITTGTDTQLISSSYIGGKMVAVELSTNKVFIAYDANGASHYLHGMICIINGTTITPGTDTELSSSSNSGSVISAVLLNENKVFIAHGSRLYGMICTISRNKYNS